MVSRTRFRALVSPASAMLATLAALPVGGCKKTPPSKVEVEIPEVITSKEPVSVTLRLFDDRGVATITRDPQKYTLSPEGVATATEAGQLTCERTGDAKLEVDVLGVGASADVKCRIVDSIEVKTPERLSVDSDPIELDVALLDASGKPLDPKDVPLELRSDTQQFLSISGTQITPKAVGETEITLQAGGVKKTTTIAVVRTVKDPLTINDGKRLSYSLEPGSYRVEISLPEPREIAVEWIGAPGCNKKVKESKNEVLCNLNDKGTLVVGHPTPGEDSGISNVVVQQVP